MPVARRKTMPVGLVIAALVVALIAASQSSLLNSYTAPARREPAHGGTDTATRLLGFTAEPDDAASLRTPAAYGMAHGVVVTSVAAGSAASRAGLEIGDRVVSIDGQRADMAWNTLRYPPHILVIVHRDVARTLVLQ
jgi:S1-C subfamily serine protease